MAKLTKPKPSSASALIGTDEQRSIKHIDLFKRDLAKASDAAIGVIAIRTREPYQCQEAIAELALETEHDFRVWTILTGWQTFPLRRPEQDATTTDDPLDFVKPRDKDLKCDLVKALDELETFDREGYYVAMSPQPWFDNPAFQQHLKVHVRRALDNNQRVILLIPESADIPSAIEDDIHVIDFRTPSHAELRELWEGMLGNIGDGNNDTQNCQPNFSDEETDLIIQNAIGMSAHEFDTALAMTFVELRDRLAAYNSGEGEGERVTPQDFIGHILKTKVGIIKKTDLLELLPSVRVEDVGGLDLLKEWVAKRRYAFSDAARKYGIEQPKGCLIVGPPGTGKSLIAKAISSVLSVPCVRFDFGRVFGQYVGQSEGRIRKALKMVEAMAPCVLFIDEIDKGLGGLGGGSDSGTTSRVFGTFLTWMQERPANAAPIFVVMTANNIAGMPPELMRRGRVDEIFAVTFPTAEERAAILKIHLAKRGHESDLTDDELRKVAKSTNNFVGAELEAIVKDALIDAFDPKQPRDLAVGDLVAQAEGIIPLSKSFAAQVAAMNEWAKNNAKPASRDITFGEPESSGGSTGTIRRGASIRRVSGKAVRPSRGVSED